MRNFEEIKKELSKAIEEKKIIKERVEQVTNKIDDIIDILIDTEEETNKNESAIEKLYQAEIEIENTEGYIDIKNKVLNLRLELIEYIQDTVRSENMNCYNKLTKDIIKLFEDCKVNIKSLETITDFILNMW